MSLDCTHVPNFWTCWLTCQCHGNINCCRSPPRHQFTCLRVHSYRAARMLNQLRRGHRAWPMFELKGGVGMAAPAAPMPPHLLERFALCMKTSTILPQPMAIPRKLQTNLNCSLNSVLHIFAYNGCYGELFLLCRYGGFSCAILQHFWLCVCLSSSTWWCWLH